MLKLSGQKASLGFVSSPRYKMWMRVVWIWIWRCRWVHVAAGKWTIVTVHPWNEDCLGCPGYTESNTHTIRNFFFFFIRLFSILFDRTTCNCQQKQRHRSTLCTFISWSVGVMVSGRATCVANAIVCSVDGCGCHHFQSHPRAEGPLEMSSQKMITNTWLNIHISLRFKV